MLSVYQVGPLPTLNAQRAAGRRGRQLNVELALVNLSACNCRLPCWIVEQQSLNRAVHPAFSHPATRLERVYS